MQLEPERTLLHFRLTAKIGAGGMGEVWSAIDTTLNRPVALKFLPAEFADDPDRTARFEREAKLLAALNHANIAAVHSVHTLEDAGSTVRFLSLELVDGEDLAERLARGPLPLDEALEVARQIAAGCEAAHARGVIHRDLKPANVKVTPDGEVKVLDFGLAKALAGEAGGASADPALSPTMTSAGTVAGVILGTASYMSPEQAKGRPVDRRADTWAFGCVLYEMLTGARAIPGDTIAEVIGAVLHREPDLSLLPPETPASVRRLIERCLRKNPKERLRDMGDAGLELTDEPDGPVAESGLVTTRKRSPWLAALPWAIATFALVALAVFGFKEPQPPVISRTAVTLPDELSLEAGVTLTPDGRTLLFAARDESGETLLYSRDLGSFEVEPIAGTGGAREAFVSPDGRWVGFSSEGKIRKVPIEGGAVIDVCSGTMYFGAVWTHDDEILFGEGLASTLLRVPAAGGEPQAMTRIDAERGEVSHGRPHLLPDGKHVLFTIGTERSSDIGLLALGTGESRVLMEGAAGARYLPTGHLVFSRGGTLRVVPFDLDRLEVRGEALQLLDGLDWRNTGGLETSFFDVSSGGALAYALGNGAESDSKLVRVDRDGVAEEIALEPGGYFHPRVSPDGKKVAVTHINDDGTGDVWVIDIDRGSRSPLTIEGANYTPLWTPDGRYVAYVSNGNIAWRAIEAGSRPEMLLEESVYQRPISFSPDGKLLSFVSWTAERGEIGVLSIDDGVVTRLESPFHENTPVFSPDGAYLAYVSAESGQMQIYVRGYPETHRKWTISANGGRDPVWSSTGDELFYRNGDRMLAVSFERGPEPSFGKPQLLFERPLHSQPEVPNFDALPEGRGFLMVDYERPRTGRIHVVQNWFADIQSGR